jgi:hypothetical protein
MIVDVAQGLDDGQWDQLRSAVPQAAGPGLVHTKSPRRLQEVTVGVGALGAAGGRAVCRTDGRSVQGEECQLQRCDSAVHLVQRGALGAQARNGALRGLKLHFTAKQLPRVRWRLRNVLRLPLSRSAACCCGGLGQRHLSCRGEGLGCQTRRGYLETDRLVGDTLNQNVNALGPVAPDSKHHM